MVTDRVGADPTADPRSTAVTDSMGDRCGTDCGIITEDDASELSTNDNPDIARVTSATVMLEGQ